MIVSLLDLTVPIVQSLAETCGEPIAACGDRAAAMRVLPAADILITNGGAPLLDEAMLDAAKQLRLVLSISAGVDKLPLDALHKRGITVCNSRGAHALSISEYVLGAMLCVSYRFPLFIRNQDRAHWETFSGIEGLSGKTLCIVGAGSIGTVLGKKASTLGMRVIGLKRHAEPLEGFDEVRPITTLCETLGEGDFVVLITPLTAETCHLINEEAFACMKQSAVFINVSRGDTVDEAALIRALETHAIAGAVLDVFHEEPMPPTSPLWSMPNVLVTPHNSALTKDVSEKTTAILSENIRRLRNGTPLINVIESGKPY